MAETMEQYMSKTRADYGSGVARPKIEDKDKFELKGQFLKELPIQAQLNNLGREIKRVNEKVYAAQERGFGSLPSSTEANPRDQVKSISTTIEADSCPISRIGSSQYAVSTRQSRTLMYETRQTKIPFPSRLNSYYYEENKGTYGPQFSEAYSEASHINNSIPRKEKDPGTISVLHSRPPNLGLGELAHTKLTVELPDMTVKYPKGIAENILGRPFLSTARAKIDVYKRKINLRVGEERIVFTSVKPASSLIKRVYMLSLRERVELDLEARLIGETLMLNRSLDPFFEDYTELNDLNKPFELRRNQGDDLMPTIEEGEVIEEFRTWDDELDDGIDDYPSYCDYDKKIHIDCAHNLKLSCMIGFEFTYANFFPLLYVNVMFKKFHNSILKEKLEYKENNVVGSLMNIPIFVEIFSVMTDFAVLENTDTYRDEGMGDESKYENPSNIATNSFFFAYEVRGIEKQSLTKRKYYNASNSINELPNKRRCKAEKFEAIQYSLGPNEEYIAIRSYEYDIWERNEDNMSKICQDIFHKKDKGWKDLVKEISMNIGGEFMNMEILKCWSVETSRQLFNTKYRS
ncbi:hypothetical protein Tco_1029395 [Tanacetum coccineum]|uniref:Reverse transcriptase domain-containing protein n=1 Tax=Tanacetum coccineum TaxID=301880 RepID=A0ABQ5G3V7_9ASTR